MTFLLATVPATRPGSAGGVRTAVSDTTWRCQQRVARPQAGWLAQSLATRGLCRPNHMSKRTLCHASGPQLARDRAAPGVQKPVLCVT